VKPVLDEYRKKRDPQQTPEPFGGTLRGATSGHSLCFVVQQHDATAMHWDLRLEINGVLVSFAVPRGMTLDPEVKRLAVLTEDHPLEYAHFEGVIPKGNYGAGAMILWDRGSYASGDGKSVEEGLAAGKMDLVFRGLKMRGRWTLVRIKKDGNVKDWLLIHKPARGVITQQDLAVTLPHSVMSGLTVAELDAGVDRTEALARRARELGAVEKAVDGSRLSPMLADASVKPFTRDGWVFEVKLDGYRGLVWKQGPDRVRIFTRKGNDVTDSFPEVARAARHLPVHSFLMDGEIVALTEKGVSSFGLLQQRTGVSDGGALARFEVDVPAHLFAFDLIALGNLDLRGLTLSSRKELLKMIVPRIGVIRYQDDVEREGELLFDTARQLGLEGIIAKRSASTYQDGRRGDDWVKMKPLRTADVVIVGASPGKGNNKDLGAVLVAWQKDGELVYAGRVGSGFESAMRTQLLIALKEATIPKRAFGGEMERQEKGTFFVEPTLVAEVKYTEVTDAGMLRHPVFLRLRTDKGVMDCDAPTLRETPVQLPASVEKAPAQLKLTNLDKLYFPQDGYTKGDLITYYEQAWPWIQHYLRDRPVVLTRYPDGVEGKNFYQKNAPSFTPEWVETLRIEDTDYFVCNTLDTLLYVVNSGAIPLHVWSARRQSLDLPDWCILDLDPKGAPFAHVLMIARTIHDLLGELKAPHYIKTSGQAGLHILVPLGGQLNHTQSKMLAELLARVVVSRLPDIATVERVVNARGGKVYVDHLQNGFGKLIASQLSARPKPGAPVSTPLTWDEVDGTLNPSVHTIKTVPDRLRRLGDPMRPLLETTVDVEALLGALARRL
jgi:bifunctional non-homologous end joining protein LigD